MDRSEIEIVVRGPNGTGKTTIAGIIADALRAAGHDVSWELDGYCPTEEKAVRRSPSFDRAAREAVLARAPLIILWESPCVHTPTTFDADLI